MLVTTEAQLEEAVASLWAYRDTGFILDTETSGLEMFRAKDPARLCSIQLAPQADPSKQWYFPFRHGEGINLDLKLLQPLRELLEGTQWLAHNASFDCKILACDGFALPPSVRCSRIASKMANENEVNSKFGKAYSLKKLAAQHFGEENITASVDLKAELRARKLSTKNDGLENLHKLPAEIVYQYGVADLTLCHRLHEFKLVELKKWRLLEAYERKCVAQLALIRMEQRGLPLNLAEVERQRSQLAPRLQMLIEEINEMKPGININSPKQLCEWLQLPKTDKKFLKTLIDANPTTVNPAIRKVLEYREGKKATSTYFDPFVEKADTEARLHPGIDPCGAKTGRYSSSNPNGQNITNKRDAYDLKSCFEAAPGYFLYNCDYKSLEPRVGAFFTRDEGSIDVFQRDDDYYRPLAAKMFNLSEEEVTKQLRNSTKSTALGINYGMGSWKLAVTQGLKHAKQLDGTYAYHAELVWRMNKQTGELEQVPCSVADPVFCGCEGKKLISWFFNAAPSMQPTIKAVNNTYARNEYIRFPLSGRVRRLEKYWDADLKRRSTNAHKGFNSLLQGTGADIMEAAIIAIDREISESDARMLLTVHDSLLFEVRIGPNAHEVCDRILELMETTMRLDPVPLVAEAEYGLSWGKMEKYTRLRPPIGLLTSKAA